MRRLSFVLFALALTAACTEAPDLETERAAITTTDPTIETRSGPNYFLNGESSSAHLVSCMLDFVLRAGPSVYTIALHGLPSEIEALPPAGTVAGSGASTVVVSSCFGGAGAPGDESIAQYVARTEGIPCEQVFGCTGSVYPICGPDGTTTMPDGSTTPGTPELHCDGVWVNGCAPATAVTPVLPGVRFTTRMTTNPSGPVSPGAVTVGCFAGDLPSDVWRRCRGVYNDHRPVAGSVCSSVWNELPSDPRKAECDALVRSCIQNTLAVCAALPPPPPPGGPAPVPVVAVPVAVEIDVPAE